MLTPILNELSFDLLLLTEGPLLIRDGRFMKKKNQQTERDSSDIPDSIFVSRNTKADAEQHVRNRTAHQLDFYVPGSSLRGVLRSRAEYICRQLAAEQRPICCNIFDTDKESATLFCGRHFELLGENDENPRQIPARDIYAASCAVCKIFGSTAMAGRLRIADSEPMRVKQTVIRDHVAIDRFTGGAREGALFQDLCLKEGHQLQMRVRIINFEIWQLGLLAYVLRDMEQGRVPLGGGVSKGYGSVNASIWNLRVRYASRPSQNSLLGIAELEPELAERYGCLTGLENPDIAALRWVPDTGVAERVYGVTYKPEQENESVITSPIWQACAKTWNAAHPHANTGIPHLKTLQELR